ncbi:hypothetical protein VE02_07008 [Pseudogymnoascus sp. 03VT05]|nr:hypothetical protein VE02_07008 [Pseudogymnoascus sp. 03VT05]
MAYASVACDYQLIYNQLKPKPTAALIAEAEVSLKPYYLDDLKERQGEGGEPTTGSPNDERECSMAIKLKEPTSTFLHSPLQPSDIETTLRDKTVWEGLRVNGAVADLFMCSADCKELMQKWVFAGAQNSFGINSKDNSGRTPLSHAAGNGHESAVKLLLNMDGVEPDSRDNFSRTPLSRAAMVGHAAVVESLLAQGGVDPDAEDDVPETPLILAAMYGHDAVVKLLLDTGRVVPEFKDAKYGRTPLSWVAEKGNAAAVEMLLGTAYD